MSRGFDQWLDLAWAAGLLEGEGSFTVHSNKAKKKRYPAIYCASTDKDVVERVAKVFNVGHINSRSPHPSSMGTSPQWVWKVSSGKDAIQVMKAVLPFMGKRRTSRIKQLLSGDMRTVKQTLDDLTSNMVQCKNHG